MRKPSGEVFPDKVLKGSEYAFAAGLKNFSPTLAVRSTFECL